MFNHPVRKVGKVKDAHGIKGDLYLLVFSKDTSWAFELKHIYLQSLDSKKELVFEVESARPHKDGLVVKTKEIKDRTAAEALKGFIFFIEQSLLETEEEDPDFYLTEIEGFEIIDENHGELGQILSFGFNGAQDLLNIIYKNQEVSIPLVEDWILDINFDDGKIFLKMPEGLLESQIGSHAQDDSE